MALLKEFSAAGVAITDEVVHCDESVTIGGTTYYRGYLAHTCNANIAGNDSADYGVWTAAAKGGSRKNVLIRSYPGVAGNVGIDTRAGYLYATSSMTLYVRYLAHEPLRRGPGALDLYVPWLMPAGGAVTLGTFKLGTAAKFCFALVDVEGGAPSADATVTVSNGFESATFTIPQAGGASAVELSSPLTVTAVQTLTVSTADGKGAFGVRFQLRDI